MRLGPIMLLSLAACAPAFISREAAEHGCMDEALRAQSPQTTAELGIGNHGQMHSQIGIEISADYLAGRDPEQVYANCVYRRSGQAPSQNLRSRLNRKG